MVLQFWVTCTARVCQVMGTRPLDVWDLCCVSPRATSRGGSRGMSATQRGVGALPTDFLCSLCASLDLVEF